VQVCQKGKLTMHTQRYIAPRDRAHCKSVELKCLHGAISYDTKYGCIIVTYDTKYGRIYVICCQDDMRRYCILDIHDCDAKAFCASSNYRCRTASPARRERSHAAPPASLLAADHRDGRL
jgi:hypothetical protein